MAKCDCFIDINAPVETVWDLTQNAARRPEWDYRITDVKLLNANLPGKGVRLRSTGRMLAASFTMEMEYISFEHGQRSAVKLLQSSGLPFVKGGGSWRYEALDGQRCRFRTTIHMNGKPSRAGELADRLVLQPFLLWMTRRSLAQLKKIAEADASRNLHYER